MVSEWGFLLRPGTPAKSKKSFLSVQSPTETYSQAAIIGYGFRFAEFAEGGNITLTGLGGVADLGTAWPGSGGPTRCAGTPWCAGLRRSAVPRGRSLQEARHATYVSWNGGR